MKFFKKNLIFNNSICINLSSIFLIDLKIPKDIMSRNIELIFKFNLYSGYKLIPYQFS